MVEHFIVADLKLQLGIWGYKKEVELCTSGAVEWKGDAEAVGSNFITAVGTQAQVELEDTCPIH